MKEFRYTNINELLEVLNEIRDEGMLFVDEDIKYLKKIQPYLPYVAISIINNDLIHEIDNPEEFKELILQEKLDLYQAIQEVIEKEKINCPDIELEAISAIVQGVYNASPLKVVNFVELVKLLTNHNYSSLTEKDVITVSEKLNGGQQWKS